MCEVRWVTSRCPRYFSNSKETIPVSLPKSCDRVWNRVTKSTSQEEHTNDFLFLCKDLYLQREWTHAQSLISCTLGRCLFYFNAVYSTKCQWMTSCWHSAHCYQSFSSRLSKAIFPYPFCFVSLITITKMTTKPSNILSHEISLPAILLSLKCFGVKQRDLEHDSKGSPLKLSLKCVHGVLPHEGMSHFPALRVQDGWLTSPLPTLCKHLIGQTPYMGFLQNVGNKKWSQHS